MSDTQRIFSIKIDGVEQGITNFKKLEDVLNSVNNDFTQAQITTRALQQAEADRKSTLSQIAKIQTANSGSIKEMTASLALLRKQYDTLSKAERENENVGGKLLKQIQSLDKELKAAKESTGRFQDNVGNYKSALEGLDSTGESFRKQLTDLRNAMQAMISQGIDPSSEAYQELSARYLDVIEKQKQFNEQMNDAASRTSLLDNIANLGTTMASSFGAVNSVMAIFGKDTEKMNEALKKSAAAFALVNQAQTIYKNLTDTSSIENKLYTKLLNLMSIKERKLALDKTKTNAAISTNTGLIKADVAAKKMDAAATETVAIAETKATVAAHGLKAAIASTGVGLLLVGLGELVNLLSRVPEWISNANREAKNLKETINGIDSRNINISIDIEENERQMEELKRNYEDQLKVIEDYYAEQERLAGNNKSAVIAIQREKNMAIKAASDAFYDTLTEEEKKYIEGLDSAVKSAIDRITSLKEQMKANDLAQRASNTNVKDATKAVMEQQEAYDELGRKAKNAIEEISGLKDSIKYIDLEDSAEIRKSIEAISKALDEGGLKGKAKEYLEGMKSLLEGLDEAINNQRDAAEAERGIQQEKAEADRTFTNNLRENNKALRDLHKERLDEEQSFTDKMNDLYRQEMKTYQDVIKAYNDIDKETLQNFKFGQLKQSVETNEMSDIVKSGFMGIGNNGGDPFQAIGINGIEEAKRVLDTLTVETNTSLEKALDIFENYLKNMLDMFDQEKENEIEITREARDKEIRSLKDSLDSGLITREEYNERALEVNETYENMISNIEEKNAIERGNVSKDLMEMRKKLLEDYTKYADDEFKREIDSFEKYRLVTQERLNQIGNRKTNGLGLFNYDEEKKRLTELATTYSELLAKTNMSGGLQLTSLETKKALTETALAFADGEEEIKKYSDELESLNREIELFVTEQKTTEESLKESVKETTNDLNNLWYDYTASLAGYFSDAYYMVADVIGSVFDLMDAKLQGQIEDIERRYDEASEKYDKVVEEYEASEERLKSLQDELKDADATRSLQIGEQIDREIEKREKLAREERKLAEEKKRLEREQNRLMYSQEDAQLRAQYFTAIANIASGIAQNLGAYPWPYSLIPVGIVSASGALQIATINEQRSNLKSAYAGKFAEGGMIEGPRHSEGGVKLEAEGGEYIINRKATRENYGVIDYINHSDHRLNIGELAQAIGRSYGPENPTLKSRYADGGYVPSVKGVGTDISDVLSMISAINFSPVVSVVDIEDAQARLVRVRDIAGV